MKNKKSLWSLLTIVMVAMLNVCFVSCGNDDDDEGATKSVANLVGLWEMTNVKGTSSETGSFNVNVSISNYDEFEDLDVADFVRYEFGADNKFICYTFHFGKDEWRADKTTTYKLDGETLTIGDKTNRPETVKISSLTSNQLVLHYVEDEGDDDLVMDVTMKRIK